MERINKLEKEIEDLRRILNEKEEELHTLRSEWDTNQPTHELVTETNYGDGIRAKVGDKLPRWAIERYSRQILLPEIGVCGQERLCSARVLVVGAGGLGCPAAVYLAGAGVGEIGIVDYDTVELTNIHRQFLHGEVDQGVSKAHSAADSLRSINSRIKITPYQVQLNSQNAVQIASQYDIVLDCTDNVPTRYLLNDLCVLTKIPLISGSALKLEGQLTIYGYRANNNSNEKASCAGPCYRCLFPSPPPAEAVGSCSAHGVAGPVPGAIGALQALEAIKYIVGQSPSQLLVGRMLIFDGEDMSFRTVKLRPRNPECVVCSDRPTISHLIDYEMFCKAQASDKKIHDSLKSEYRKREKEKRMTGQSYHGFRTRSDGDGTRWIQDVPKSERKMGPTCASELCKSKHCTVFDETKRKEIFTHFWNDLDWKSKKSYVRSLVDYVPVKRRRVKLKGVVSRKGDSKMYHLKSGADRLPVCRVMFLNTLGVKEAMVRCWLTNDDRPKATKRPLKAINVESYIDNLPKLPPKCQLCAHSRTNIQYVNLENVKNQFQLYNLYVHDMKLENLPPASRKTFSKVVNLKNIRIFKPKNVDDTCDLISEHNSLPIYKENDLQCYCHGDEWR